MKVVHVIAGLDVGGAEMMLYKLVSRLSPEKYDCKVVSLTGSGPIGRRLEEAGVEVRALGMQRGVPNPSGLLRLARLLRREKPHVVQTWMYHADLLGGLAARMTGTPVIWGVRHTNLSLGANRLTTVLTARACAAASGWLPARIVCCSEASREAHARLGYAANKMMVIPNGFDLEIFKPDPEARRSFRAELGLPDDAPVIGLVARFNPQKDHRNFVRAAGMLARRFPAVRFVLCGQGVTPDNDQLAQWLASEGIHERCRLMGCRQDMPRVTAALDIATSSSCGEGFPNVIGEAMACGVPCAVTDVGDSAFIVGDMGKVVPPKNPEALCEACSELLAIGPQGRAKLGAAARSRVIERFNLPAVVAQYEAVYQQVAGGVSV